MTVAMDDGGEQQSIDDFVAGFSEDPGYLDFARVGPIGHAVGEESSALDSILERSRFGTLEMVEKQDARVRDALSVLTGFAAEQIVFQPNTSQGLMHTMFGITGAVALSRADYPSLTVSATRASEALGVLTPVWLETDAGRVTPGNLKSQLRKEIVAVAVSLVDYRTGYLVDIEGIRQVIGDRLLIVDATQAMGVVDAPYGLADVVAGGGYKWLRAGWGTGFLCLSERALQRLTPVFSGHSATDGDPAGDGPVPPPARGAKAFAVSWSDPVAQARLAAAVEGLNEVGVAAVNARLEERVSAVIDLADEFGLPVSSARPQSERAGIVVVTPAPDHLTVLVASLHNHGVSVTVRDDAVRISPHVSTTDETLEMLRASFTAFAGAANL